MLTEDLRAAFAQVTGYPLESWLNPGTKYCADPGEAFAFAYALLSNSTPWRNSFPVSEYWPQESDPLVLSTAREVIQEACHKQSPVART